jgi:hypothetical protein
MSIMHFYIYEYFQIRIDDDSLLVRITDFHSRGVCYLPNVDVLEGDIVSTKMTNKKRKKKCSSFSCSC